MVQFHLKGSLLDVLEELEFHLKGSLLDVLEELELQENWSLSVSCRLSVSDFCDVTFGLSLNVKKNIQKICKIIVELADKIGRYRVTHKR